jgi:hypothetical protein
MMFSNLFKLASFVVLVSLAPLSAHADDTATLLFERNAPQVFQIKVIDKASGNKASIGSGFQISPTGVIATNYHVVSDYILEREMYRIEVRDHDDEVREASLINFDIVHDLALLQVEGLEKTGLNLSQSPLAHGNRIYSMGNPNDLGMTIVEGTYNGLVEASRYRKYLFSGSLNPGMSGGPVFDAAGDVIGINVSKGGEQLSFLVPVEHLADLVKAGFEPLNTDDYKTHANSYLMRDQDNYYGMLTAMEWLTLELQQSNLPDKFHDSLKCWGHTLDKEQNLYDEVHRHCKTTDEIFVNSNLYTGSFSFNYQSITSDELITPQFYKLLEQNHVMADFSNGSSTDDTTNFSCLTDFVELDAVTVKHSEPWKVTTCVREYVEYRGLYDAGLIATRADSNDGSHEALVISLYTTGIDRDNISKMHNKFLEHVR